MYESHFGFNGSPFQLNPDPAFYFDSRGHSNALAYLKFGAHQGEGFIVVTGEIGAGKTTLVRTLLEGLNPEQVVAAQVVSTQLESSELLQAILMAFGIASSSTSKAHLIANLEGHFTALAAKGRRALLIIDEAQNLKHEAVEELRMLSNFQLGKYGLLQSFLVGQPELRVLLQSKSMEQLRQRVIASCHLGPLDQVETRAYVEHRLRRVGWNGTSPQFAAGVLDRVHYWTGGVPRKINRLCNRMLLGAFLTNADSIAMSLVDETATELRNEVGDGLVVGLPEPAVRSDPVTTLAMEPPSDTTPKTSIPATSTSPEITPQLTASPVAAAGDAASPAPPTVVDASVTMASQVQTPALPLDDDASPRNDEALTTEPIPRRASVTRRAHQEALSSCPLLCLVDSTTHYLMAGALQAVFQGSPSLPSVVAVNVGAESKVWSVDLEQCGFSMPALGLHLGIDLDQYSGRTVRAVAALNEVFDTFDPCAVLVFGSSEEDLAGALLANKRNLRVLRVGSGQRDLHSRSAHQLNAVLIERIADLHFTDSTASFYALYREGIRLDRVRSVGNLAREVFDQASPLQRMSPTAPRSWPAQGEPPNPNLGFGLVHMNLNASNPYEAAFTSLVATLCQIGEHLPLVWLAEGPAHERLLDSKHAAALQASRITVVLGDGYLSNLSWLRHSRCLITTEGGTLLNDALSLGLAVLTLQANGEATTPIAVHSELPVGKDLSDQQSPLHRILAERSVIEEAPAYWNTGTASRIAAQLVAWLPRQGAQAATARPASSAPEDKPDVTHPGATRQAQLADSP